MGTATPILAFPRHPLRGLVAKPGPMRSLLASYDRLCTLGRDAIYWGLKSHRSKLGDCVWMPSFHCGVEVQAAVDAGFDVDFYRIRHDLSIDEEDLGSKFVSRPGPVMIIHYFGFAQPALGRLADLCHGKATILIEDCSHALFSSFNGQPLGTFGHVAAFSLYKTLGLCDGGALSLNRKQWLRTIGTVPSVPARGRPTLYGYRLQLRSLAKNALGPSIARRLQRRQAEELTSPEESYAPEDGPGNHPLLQHPHDYRGGMSMLSRRLASTMDPALILRRRKDNWQFLHGRLSACKGYRNMFPVVQDGACPLYLPIRVSRREVLSSALGEKGIETFVFGRYPHPRMIRALYPEARALREEILCLPLHQYMSEPQLEFLVQVAGPLLEKHAI